VDVLGGFVLAGLCFYIVREEQPRWPVVPNSRIGVYYAVGAIAAAVLATAGWPWTSILLWPSLSLALVAIAYVGCGPAIYRKIRGRIPMSARLLLAPCLIGQRLSLLYYRRQCDAWNSVTPNVWIGTRLDDREAMKLRQKGVTAVLDLAAEFSEATPFLDLNYRNIPVLDLTALNPMQLREAVGFIKEQSARGVVYVHCKVGYSRTAVAVGAYLIASGQAQSASEALALLPGRVRR
jgi:hypothetical protein